jgi:Acyltransferase family
MSVRNSSIAKGCAIILMLTYHIFAFSSRYPAHLAPIPLFKHPDVFFHLSHFGQVCVGMFLFLSGYGLSCSRRDGFTSGLIRRLLSFFSLYWVNVVFLIGLTWLIFGSGPRVFGHESQDFPMDARSILLNLTACSSSYCGEWWFARLYLECLLLVHPMYLMLSARSKWLTAVLSLLLVCASVRVKSIDNVLMWQASFVAGCLSAQQGRSIFEKWLQRLLELRPTIKVVSSLALMIACVMLRKDTAAGMDFLIAPVFIMGAVSLVSLAEISGKVLDHLGKYSSSMWLNHGFICYYWTNQLFYKLRQEWILLVTLVLSSLLMAYLLEPLITWLRKLLVSIAERRSFQQLAER